MIVLDTNVLSEMMRPSPDPSVFAWLASQPRPSLYTTSINQAEILYGIAALDDGRRKRDLAAAAQAMFAQEFAGRLLGFGQAAASHYARIVATRRRMGNPIEGFDALIAATALAAGASVATRDIGGFAGCGIELVNPWDYR